MVMFDKGAKKGGFSKFELFLNPILRCIYSSYTND